SLVMLMRLSPPWSRMALMRPVASMMPVNMASLSRWVRSTRPASRKGANSTIFSEHYHIDEGEGELLRQAFQARQQRHRARFVAQKRRCDIGQKFVDEPFLQRRATERGAGFHQHCVAVVVTCEHPQQGMQIHPAPSRGQ